MKLKQIRMRAGAVKNHTLITLEFKAKHGLQPQHLVQIFKGSVPLCRYFPSKHGVTFLKGGYSLSVEAQFPGYRVAVFGADGTFLLIRHIRSPVSLSIPLNHHEVKAIEK